MKEVVTKNLNEGRDGRESGQTRARRWDEKGEDEEEKKE